MVVFPLTHLECENNSNSSETMFARKVCGFCVERRQRAEEKRKEVLMKPRA